MSKIELNTSIADFGWSQINANFQLIENELNQKVFYRLNPIGEPNELNNTLDVNGNRIINLPPPVGLNEPARMQDLANVLLGTTNANLITFTPTGSIAATNVQTAIVEVNTELQASVALKANTASPTFTGLVSIPALTTTGTVTFSQRPTFNGAVPWDALNLVSPAVTTGGLSQFGTFTSASLASLVTDETGSGALVFGTAPTIGSPVITGGSVNNAPIGATTPNTGAFTSLSATGSATVGGNVTVTGSIIPSQTNGITGTTTNNNVAAGGVGEYVNSTTTTPGVSLTTVTSANITSISLTAGDWDVYGHLVPVPQGGVTTIAQTRAAITSTSAAIGAYGDPGTTLLSATQAVGTASIATIVPIRFSLSATTTIFLVGNITFSGGTCTAFGTLTARRRR